MDKAALLAPLPEADVEISVGTVKVRGMSRSQAVGQLAPCDAGDEEGMIVHLCMIDPQLDFEEAKQWAKGGRSKDVQAVIEKALELSGGAPGQNLERPFREG